MKNIFKPQEFGKMIGRSVNTLQRWDRDGILKARRTPTNRRYYTIEDYNRTMGIQNNFENQVNDVIIYARASNQNQKDDLKNQYEWFDNFLKSKGSEIIVVNNENLSPQQELVGDLISIIHIFSCRIYGLRKYKKKIKNDKEL